MLHSTDRRPNGRHRRRGSVIVLLAVLIPVLFGLASYAINIAYIEAVQADVQVTTDVAAKSAGQEFILTGDRNAAMLAAREAATRNPISGNVIPFELTDFEFGTSLRSSSGSRYDFSPTGEGKAANAVRLTTIALSDAATPILSPIFPTLGVDIEIRPRRVAVSTQSTMDLSLVIDRSGSMAFAADETASADYNPAAAPAGWMYGDPVPPNSRWLDMVASVQVFLQQLTDSPQKEKVSLSTYSDVTSTEQVLTFDYDSILDGLNMISVAFNGGSTAIGYGMYEGAGALDDTNVNRDYAVKVMVLLTDGIHYVGTSPEKASKHLRNNGVTLFTITFSDEADQERMEKIAESSGGLHYHAADASQLADAFQEIAKRLPSLITQ